MDKEINFKITKSGRYFRSEYIRYQPSNVVIDVWVNNSNLHEDREATEKYMKYLLDIEPVIESELEKRNLPYNPKRIIVTYLRMLGSWTEEFDIRWDLGIEKHAELLVNAFDKDYTEAKEKCEKTLEMLKETKEGYLDNYREFDDYKRYNDLYEFGMEELEPYYGEDRLDKISDLIDKTHELLVKFNEEQGNK